METCEPDTKIYEDCVSNSSDLPSSRDGELKTMDFEECSFDEDSFNESVKHKPHSTMLFSNVDRLVQHSDDEDMECSYSEKIESDTCDDNNSVKPIFSLHNLKPRFKTGPNVKWLKKKKSSSFKSKPFESSAIIVDSSLENSPVFTKKSAKLKNRIINSGSESDDLTTENVSRKSASAFDNGASNVTNKSVNKNGHSRNSYFKNVTTQNCMGHEENKHSSEDVSDKSLSSNSESEQDINAGTNVITSTLSEIGIDSENRNYPIQIRQGDNVTVTSAIKVKSSNSKCRRSDVIIVNSDSDENDFQHNSDKILREITDFFSMQDDNASTASVIEVIPNKFQGRPNDVIIINSDSDEDDVQHVQTEYCDKNLNIPTRHGTDDNVSNMFSKQVLGNDLATRVESLLAEDERLKLQIAEALRIVVNSQAELINVNTRTLPDKGSHLQKNLLQHQDLLRKLHCQQKTLTSELSKLLDSTNTSQQTESVQQAAQNKKQSHSVQPVWNKLPTSTTNIAHLGQRALETHRTQQTLILNGLKTLHKSLETCPSIDTMSKDPEALLVELMPHQKHALSWLLWRENQKPPGGILADDMGLGKTLTMISLVLKGNEEKLKKTENDEETDDDIQNEENTHWIASSKEKNMRKGKTLVVCPATLLGQWESEINKRVQPGFLDLELHHGTDREKNARRLARKDIVISTYSIIMRDFGDVDSKKDGNAVEKGPLFHIRWERVILDEAHQIRNYKSKTAVAVCSLRAKYRWALTGTPVHNKELDFFALLKFLRCSPFDDINVWHKWVDNQDAAGLQRLSTITKSLMLRRTKKELQAKGSLQTLKDKSESLIYVRLDDEELKVYKKMLDFSKTLFAQYLHQKAEKENMLSNIHVSSNVNRYLHTVESPFKNHPELARLHRRMTNMPDVKSHVVLVLLLRLRQICCHPSLMKSMLDKEICQQDGIDDAEGLDLDLMARMNTLALDDDSEPENSNATRKIAFLSPDNPVFSEDRLSSKVRCMLTALQEVLCSGDKVVIVSQWTSMLNIIHSMLHEQKIDCALLTGSVPVKQRMAIVEDFNCEHHGAKVLLLSLTAGGVGLNLVGANHLMLLDLHWNPQLETQACDRVYRVGQKKSVKIYKFVCSDTIEENILKLQEKKLALADNVLTGAKLSQISKLTLSDLKMLFNIS